MHPLLFLLAHFFLFDIFLMFFHWKTEKVWVNLVVIIIVNVYYYCYTWSVGLEPISSHLNICKMRCGYFHQEEPDRLVGNCFCDF